MTKSSDIYSIAWDLAKVVEQVEETMDMATCADPLDEKTQQRLCEIRLIKSKLQEIRSSLVDCVQDVENLTFSLEEELRDIYPEFVGDGVFTSNQHFS